MPSAFADDYWTTENTGAFYPAAYNNAGRNNANNMHVQSKYLLNMAYLRIKNITLGYSFEPSLLEKVMVKTARIYVALENVVNWNHLNGLTFAPEVIKRYNILKNKK